jgi:hypothetical protein
MKMEKMRPVETIPEMVEGVSSVIVRTFIDITVYPQYNNKKKAPYSFLQIVEFVSLSF